MILGTAGHIDHGKTALVRALTGVDTDRLAEEKRRGITIDLGFAPLTLDDELRLGVVDVPGHEAFVRNMLAGATGVDLALLVIAADEGVMPQTREHLAILDLLGVRGGVVALTKRDLVDDEWAALVRDDVRAALAETCLAHAPIIETSVLTQQGLDALRAALAAAAREIPARDAGDLFRLPVDRAFTIRGTGTVVTGTVWSGSVSREGVVRVLPAGGTARVRGVETHGQAAERALPGSRAALALAGVAVDDVRRGTVLVSDGAWEPSHVLLAEVALLASAAVPLGPRSRVRFHLGTVDVGARIVTPGGALPPGGRKQARVVLDAPVIARAGDRFVIRGGSPVVTLGGGIVNDPTPPHRRPRPWSASAPSPQDRLARVLESVGNSGVARTALPVRIGASPTTVDTLLASAHGAIVAGDRLFAERVVHDAAARLVALVDAHHAHAPLEHGASLQAVRARLAVPDEVAARLVADAVARGELELDGGAVRRAGWVPALDDAQRRRRDELLATLQQAGREPPSVPELAARHGGDTQALLRLLERDGHVVQVEAERYYARPVLDDMIAQLRAQLAPGREYSPGDFRDLLGFSRKYLIPFLEYCDRVGITERRPGGRVPLTPAVRAHPGVEGGAGP